MSLATVTKNVNIDGVDFPYDALAVSGDVSMKDFIEQANADGIPMVYSVLRKGRAKEGEEKAPWGFFNGLLEVLNLKRYREALALNTPEPDPEDKAIKSLVKILGLSVEEATKRVRG